MTAVPPIAPKKPSPFHYGCVHENRGSGALIDPPIKIHSDYGWIYDKTRSDPDVIGHLHAENAYTCAMTDHLEPVRESLYNEMLTHYQEADVVPVCTTDKWQFFTETVEGLSYTIYSRAPAGAPISSRTTYFDENDVAKRLGSSFTSFGSISPSPNGRYVAYSVDVSGNERNTIYIRDIATNIDFDVVNDTATSVVWASDSGSIFYVSQSETERAYKLWRHVIRFPASTHADSSPEAMSFTPVDPAPRDHKGADAATVDRGADSLLYTEEVQDSILNMYKTVDRRFLLVGSASYTSTAVYAVRLDVPSTAPVRAHLVLARRDGVLAHVDITRATLPPSAACGAAAAAAAPSDAAVDVASDPPLSAADGTLVGVVRDSNIGDVEFHLVRGALGEPTAVTAWGPRSTKGRALVGAYSWLPFIIAFDSFAIVLGREHASSQVFVLHYWDVANPSAAGAPAGDKGIDDAVAIDFGMAVRDASASRGHQGGADRRTVRVVMSSLTVPQRSYDYDVDTRKLTLVHATPLPGDFSCDDYVTACVRVPNGDVEVPVSLVWRRPAGSADAAAAAGAASECVPPQGTFLHLYAYGSYGICADPSFKLPRLPLLKRGITYAIAHVRGGGECGFSWYDPVGKLLSKKNTFSDFVAVSEWLVDKGYTTPQRLSIEGRSAGGLTMGAALNARPDLFRAAILGVPFLDVLRSMGDPEIPLTIEEWSEIGNPNEAAYHDYIKSYSPIDNIRAAVYPPTLMLAGLHDPRVGYWEPAKYAAIRRSVADPSSGPCLLKCDMEYGHFSAADRYKYLRESAWWMAWLLDGVAQA